MATISDTPSRQQSAQNRKLVFGISSVVVAFAALALTTGLYFYDGKSLPRSTIADPTKKIGTGDQASENPIRLEKPDKPGAAGTP